MISPDLLKTYALAFIGTKYFFGGDDPISGFDCSGFVCELLRAMDVVPPHFRTNAQGVYEEIIKHDYFDGLPTFASFAFFGADKNNIDHVGFCLDNITMVEAGGGDSKTVNDQAAIIQNAFIKLRPIKYRKDFLFALKLRV